MTARQTETRYVVLDIETAPDPNPLVPAASGSAKRSSHSHVITAAAVLIAAASPDGRTLTVEAIGSWHEPSDEHDVLRALQASITPELRSGTALVTFNGLRHDVPVIRHRAAFHRMFGLQAWNLLQRSRHVDLMSDGMAGADAPWSSLAQTCAGLAIPHDHAFAMAAKATPSTTRRKCETDVCATFVLLLYTLALRTGEETVLSSGWRSLAEYVTRHHGVRPHLMQFAHAAEDQCI